MAKYQRLKRQYSIDGGNTWYDVTPYQYSKGQQIPDPQGDCDNIEWRIVEGEYICTENGGYVPPVQYRWVTAEGEVMCFNGSLYSVLKYQYSRDGGITWIDGGQTMTDELLEPNSSCCDDDTYICGPQYEITPLHYIENDVLKPIANSSVILNNNVITLHIEGLIPEVIEAGATYHITLFKIKTTSESNRYLTFNSQTVSGSNPISNDTITINSFSNVKGGEWIKFVKVLTANSQTFKRCTIPIIFYLHLGENISDTYLSDVYISHGKTTEVELRLSPGMESTEGMYLFNDALGRDNTTYTITLDLIPTANNGGVYYYSSSSYTGNRQFMTTDDFLNYLNDSSVTCHFWTGTGQYPEIANVISKTSISNKLYLSIKFNTLIWDSDMNRFWESSPEMFFRFNINDEKFAEIRIPVYKNVYNNPHKKGLIGNSRYTLLSVNNIYSVNKSFNRIANNGHESDIYDETYTDRTNFTVKEIVSADNVTRKDNNTIIYNGVEFVNYIDVIIDKGINNVYDYYYYGGGKYILYQIISDTPQLSNSSSKFGLGTKIKTGGPFYANHSFGECEFVYDGYVRDSFNGKLSKSANLELITEGRDYQTLNDHYYVNPLSFSNHGTISIPYYSKTNSSCFYDSVQTQFLGRGTIYEGENSKYARIQI